MFYLIYEEDIERYFIYQFNGSEEYSKHGIDVYSIRDSALVYNSTIANYKLRSLVLKTYISKSESKENIKIDIILTMLSQKSNKRQL